MHKNKALTSRPRQEKQRQNLSRTGGRSSRIATEPNHTQEDVSVSKHTDSNSPENRLQASILYKNRVESDKIPYLSISSTSPPRLIEQAARSTGFKSTTPRQFEAKPTVPLRTHTYSPIGSAYKDVPQHATFEPGSFFYESPGKKKINLRNSSVKVMRKVFDEEYSLASPSKKKAYDSSMYESFKAQSNLTKNMSVYGSMIELNNLDFNMLNQAYLFFLETSRTNPNLQDAPIEVYIDDSLGFVNHSNVLLRIGALINIFEIVHYNRDAIPSEQISQICAQIIPAIAKYQGSEEFLTLFCALEVIALIGPHDITYESINLFLSIVCEEKSEEIKHKAYQILLNLDYPGLFALIDLANKDFDELPLEVLNKLAQWPEIQAKVIVPSLLSTFGANDQKKKFSALAALNRMFGMIKYGGSLPVLINLLTEGYLDRELIASTLRAAGPQGEQTLLKILKTTIEPKVKQAICAVLPWRIRSYNTSKLGIKIVPYQVSQHYQQNPGTMCIYFGSLKPLSNIEISGENPEEVEGSIEINSRDFLASLQRFLSMKYHEFISKENPNVDPNAMASPNPSLSAKFLEEIKSYNNFNSLVLVDFLENKIKEDEDILNQPPPEISSNIIKSLIATYNDKDAVVRESAVHALGLIGLPEAADAVDILTKALYDPSSEVRAIAAWALGKLGDIASAKAAKRLIELLRDKYWKVRTSVCIALGYMGETIDRVIYPTLVKIIKDGSINKVVVCETLVRLGLEGEQILLDILKNAPNSDYGLKTAIIQSFELAEVDRSSIDFIIEELFRNAADPMVQVRKACLVTLEKLRLKSQNNNITYLKSRNILPLFYYFLQDAESEIRSTALQSIHSFGPQGELMLIEGLAKDKNPIIRAECAKGLGIFGPQTFRTLLFGLRDAEDSVRMYIELKATSSALRKNFSPQSVINTFSEKHHQKPGIIYSILEILNLGYHYSRDLRKYLEEILEHFQNELNMSGSVGEPRSRDRSNPMTQRGPEERHNEYINTSGHATDLMKTVTSTNFSVDHTTE